MLVQNLLVAWLVLVCFGYALWTMGPTSARNRLAAKLLTLPCPLWLQTRLQTALRQQDGCHECSLCSIGEGYGMARAHSLKPVTIVSFENLQDHLGRMRAEGGRGFIGCCCEGFYTKHARDFERAGVPGVLVGMDSATCYDLGKARDAYHGSFQQQTHINLPLLEKVLALREAAR